MRPTAAALRETLFNLIGPDIVGCRFLDLCAGSGSVGIEALSRGAEEAFFVDSHPAAIALIRRNLAALDLEGRARVLRRDAVRVLAEFERRGDAFDEVFLDPPYVSGTAVRCLRSPRWRAIIRARTRIFVEHRGGLVVPVAAGWVSTDRRKFGDTLLTVFRKVEER